MSLLYMALRLLPASCLHGTCGSRRRLATKYHNLVQNLSHLSQATSVVLSHPLQFLVPLPTTQMCCAGSLLEIKSVCRFSEGFVGSAAMSPRMTEVHSTDEVYTQCLGPCNSQ